MLKAYQTYSCNWAWINVYAPNDKELRFYEIFQLSEGDLFFVVSNHRSKMLDENSQSSSLVLTAKGLGRVCVGNEQYNAWRYKQVTNESNRI